MILGTVQIQGLTVKAAHYTGGVIPIWGHTIVMPHIIRMAEEELGIDRIGPEQLVSWLNDTLRSIVADHERILSYEADYFAKGHYPQDRIVHPLVAYGTGHVGRSDMKRIDPEDEGYEPGGPFGADLVEGLHAIVQNPGFYRERGLRFGIGHTAGEVIRLLQGGIVVAMDVGRGGDLPVNDAFVLNKEGYFSTNPHGKYEQIIAAEEPDIMVTEAPAAYRISNEPHILRAA